MNCFYHPSNKSLYSCERCNRPICSDCTISFKNPQKFKTIDDQKSNINYIDSNNDGVRLEDLSWCLPCYYAHFNADLIKKEDLISKIISIIVELLAYTMIIGVLIFLMNLEFKYSIDLQQIFSGYNLVMVIVLYALAFILLFYYRGKQASLKRIKLTEVKETFLTVTTIGAIDLPIECFYCKESIDPSSFVCMNLNCTLGEEIDKDEKIVSIEPVNSNYGLFNTLKKLPKYPPEEKEKY